MCSSDLFAGSANETAGGLVDNFESIKVFWSWDDPHGRVAEEIRNFEALWSNRTTGLRVLDFILAVDGKRPRSAQEVKEWIATSKPEGTLEFDLQRGNERGKLKVRVTERPGASPRGAKT